MNVLVLAMDEVETLVAPGVLDHARTADFVAQMYDGHQRELFTFAMRSCRDREAAEDIVQEAFMRLIVEVEAGRTPLMVRAWLYRVVANLAVSRGRRVTVARRQLGALVTDASVDGPEHAFLEHEWRTDLDVLLGELGPDARTALLMAASGFSGLEIAEAIGRSANATRAMMCRARLRLRHRLDRAEQPA